MTALDRRRRAGLPAFTVLSCDNMPGNGAATRTAVLGFAGARDTSLAAWIDAHASFPASMVDRITPRTDDRARALVAEQFGVRDRSPVVTEPFTQPGHDPRPLLRDRAIFGRLGDDAEFVQRSSGQSVTSRSTARRRPSPTTSPRTGSTSRDRPLLPEVPDLMRQYHDLDRTDLRFLLCDADGNLFPSEEPAFVASAG